MQICFGFKTRKFLTSLEFSDLVSVAILLLQLLRLLALLPKSYTKIQFYSYHKTSIGRWSHLLSLILKWQLRESKDSWARVE